MPIISLGKIDTNLIPLVIGCFFSVMKRLLYILVKVNLYEHLIITNI